MNAPPYNYAYPGRPGYYPPRKSGLSVRSIALNVARVSLVGAVIALAALAAYWVWKKMGQPMGSPEAVDTQSQRDVEIADVAQAVKKAQQAASGSTYAAPPATPPKTAPTYTDSDDAPDVSIDKTFESSWGDPVSQQQGEKTPLGQQEEVPVAGLPKSEYNDVWNATMSSLNL